jgi:transcriptional regulator with XRE-family HTH domain
MKLRQIRDGLGLSQNELIERLGLAGRLNREEISDFERGVREPDLLILKAYAVEAGIPLDYLVDDDAELPKKLPGAKHTRGASVKPQKERAKATNMITVTLWLLIESDEGAAREEERTRKAVEKYHLKRYGMKRLKDDEYDLTVSHRGEADLDEQVYTLLGEVYIEVKRRKCSMKVRVREKGGDRYW